MAIVGPGGADPPVPRPHPHPPGSTHSPTQSAQQSPSPPEWLKSTPPPYTRPCPSEDTGLDTRLSLPPIPASWCPGPSPRLAPSSPHTDPSVCPHCLTSRPTKPARLPWHLQPVLSLLPTRSQAPARPADHAQAFPRLFALPGNPSSSPSHLTNPWHRRAPSRSHLRAVGRLPPGHPCSCH